MFWYVLCVYPSIQPSDNPSTWQLSTSIPIDLPACLSVHPYISSSTRIFVHLANLLSSHPSNHPSIHPPTHPFIHPSINSKALQTDAFQDLPNHIYKHLVGYIGRRIGLLQALQIQRKPQTHKKWRRTMYSEWRSNCVSVFKRMDTVHTAHLEEAT